MYDLLKTHGADHVYLALKKIRDYPGLPLGNDVLRAGESQQGSESQIIAELIRRGIILAPDVKSLRGAKNFAFSPHIGLPLAEKVILEKAMAVLACIRYGQHFGLITKIRFPEDILDRLMNPPHRIGSHTEIKRQYALLVGRGMGKVYPDKLKPDRFYFETTPTPENKKAVKLAKDLLKIGEVLEGKGVSKDLQNVLFYPGTYEEALRTLPKLKNPSTVSPATQENILNVINDTMDKLRGA